MNRGITEVGGDRVATMGRLSPLEILGDFVERFVPADTFPTQRCATDWMLEPVFIEMNILQGDRLGADESAAEGIVFVATNVESAICALRDLDTTDRFADAAVAIVS